jgi:hypothetical protein
MVGRLNISAQADAVRHLFMAFEKDARKIDACCFCGSPWPTMKFANQGHLTGNHKSSCPFEQLADAGEQCIVLREYGSPTEKEAAEKLLSEKIDGVLAAMANVSVCPFPVCKYSSTQGHRLECPFNRFKRAKIVR